MGYQTTALGLTLETPTVGTRGYAIRFLQNFVQKISAHDHTGGGKGLQIGTAGIANSAITTGKIAASNIDDTLIRLRNNQYLRTRNAANSADLNILKVNASNKIELNKSLMTFSPWTPVITAAGSMNVSGITVNSATFYPVGSLVFFKLDIQGVLAGTPSPYIFVTLPVTAKELVREQVPLLAIDGDGTALDISSGDIFPDTDHFRLSHDNGGHDWTLGSSFIVRASGFYEAA